MKSTAHKLFLFKLNFWSLHNVEMFSKHLVFILALFSINLQFLLLNDNNLQNEHYFEVCNYMNLHCIDICTLVESSFP